MNVWWTPRDIGPTHARAGLEDGFEAVRRAHQPRHQPLGERLGEGNVLLASQWLYPSQQPLGPLGHLGRKVHADHQRASQVEGLCLVGPDLANLRRRRGWEGGRVWMGLVGWV